MVKKIVVNCKSTGKPGPCKKASQETKPIAESTTTTTGDAAQYSTWSEKAKTKSTDAVSMSKKASVKFTSGAESISSMHSRAAAMHDAAGFAHSVAAKHATNDKDANHHQKMFEWHQDAHRSHLKKKAPDLKNFEDNLTSNSTGERQMTKRERQQLINTLVANGCGCWTEEDREILKAFEPDRLRKLVANSLKSAKDEATLNTLKEKLGVDEFTEEFIANMEVNNNVDKPVTNGCSEETETGEEMPKKKKKQPVANTEGEQMTEEEWLENAPPSIRAVIESAMQVNNEAKQELVAKLTANASGDKQALTQLFMGKSIAELKLLVSALPKPTVNHQQQQPQSANRLSLAFFGGQAVGAPTTNSVLDGGEFDKDDFLPIPTINFSENN